MGVSFLEPGQVARSGDFWKVSYTEVILCNQKKKKKKKKSLIYQVY
jgi:hypothetical protein